MNRVDGPGVVTLSIGVWGRGRRRVIAERRGGYSELIHPAFRWLRKDPCVARCSTLASGPSLLDVARLPSLINFRPLRPL